MMLQRKSEVTRFQILVEVAASQPQIKQSEIAAKLGITPQAVSEYVKSLIVEGLIASGGRGQYKVTPLGVESIIDSAKELQDYSRYVLSNVVGQVSIWPAIASTSIKKGSRVRLFMRDGILYAGLGEDGAAGVATCDASAGEDIGVKDLSGLIPLIRERVKIVKVPSIESGGSGRVNGKRLERELDGLVGVAGIEAIAVLNRLGAKPDAPFGAVEFLAEAAIKGVKGTLVITSDMAPQAIQKLEAAGVPYVVVDMGLD